MRFEADGSELKTNVPSSLGCSPYDKRRRRAGESDMPMESNHNKECLMSMTHFNQAPSERYLRMRQWGLPILMVSNGLKK